MSAGRWVKALLVPMVSIWLLAGSTPAMYYGNALSYRVEALHPEYGPWRFRVGWEGYTDVTGVQASEVDLIGVYIYWEVPLGDQDPAGFGWDDDERTQSTSAAFLSSENGESHDVCPTYAWAEFTHEAAVPPLSWYPSAVVWRAAYDYEGCEEVSLGCQAGPSGGARPMGGSMWGASGLGFAVRVSTVGAGAGRAGCELSQHRWWGRGSLPSGQRRVASGRPYGCGALPARAGGGCRGRSAHPARGLRASRRSAC